jgi:two-component system, LytTR family, sensor kinase
MISRVNYLKILKHLLFWILFYGILLLLSSGEAPLQFRISTEFLNLLFYIVLVYFNYGYLIPNYLKEKQFYSYSILLVSATVILAPLKTVLYFLFYGNSPEVVNKIMENQWWVIVLLLIMGLLSTALKISSDWWRDQKEKKELERKNMESELNFLKMQINPHFLFNVLNSIYALSLKKSDKTPEIILKLSAIMRYMLYESNEKTVLLEREIENIKNYLDLEKMRRPSLTQIEFNLQGPIKGQEIAPLLLSPFVENAFKHGAKGNKEGNYILIDLQVEQGILYFWVKNNKTQPHLSSPSNLAGGIGIENVKSRLNLIYKNRHQLVIRDHPNEYEISLQVQLKKSNNNL